jgi:hypothetical protein
MRSRIGIFGTLSRVSALTVFFLAMASSVSAQEAPKKVAEKSHKETIKLEVENNNFLDMHIYGVRDGYFRSLGVVTGLTSEELTIPETLTLPGAEFQILADPIGGTLSYLSDPIVLGTGKEVDLTVQNDLALSSYVVR